MNALPALFGIKHSNRDFSLEETWGKNQFNSSFPASLFSYLASKEMKAVYIKYGKKGRIEKDQISFFDVVGLEWNSDSLEFLFETAFAPYQNYVTDGNTPIVDLVFNNRKCKKHLQSLEVKLTVLPDNSTCDLSEENFGSEMVIRPPTITYLSLSLIHRNKDQLNSLLDKYLRSTLKDLKFAKKTDVQAAFSEMVGGIREIVPFINDNQHPLILHPIWKTIGKSSRLADGCLDVFIWSDLALLKLILDQCSSRVAAQDICRNKRSLIWIIKMLWDFRVNGNFSPDRITADLVYGPRNDKAFAVNGRVSHPYMSCAELTTPRIKRNQIREIVLNGGHKLLSPERRFDSCLASALDIFN